MRRHLSVHENLMRQEEEVKWREKLCRQAAKRSTRGASVSLI